jgi:hypothetical protein
MMTAITAIAHATDATIAMATRTRSIGRDDFCNRINTFIEKTKAPPIGMKIANNNTANPHTPSTRLAMAAT